MTNIHKGRFTQLAQRVARNVGQAGVRGVKGFQNLERKKIFIFYRKIEKQKPHKGKTNF
jgi:hypothetical protein